MPCDKVGGINPPSAEAKTSEHSVVKTCRVTVNKPFLAVGCIWKRSKTGLNLVSQEIKTPSHTTVFVSTAIVEKIRVHLDEAFFDVSIL